jgi:23S rRNA (uracil1939-C5)-methyltransferase
MEPQEVTIEKLVHGGQGIAVLADGRKVFVWAALPGERARVRIIKQKSSYAEAVAEEILEPSMANNDFSG